MGLSRTTPSGFVQESTDYSRVAPSGFLQESVPPTPAFQSAWAQGSNVLIGCSQ